MNVLQRPFSIGRGAVRTLGRLGRYGASTIAGKANAIRHGQRATKPDMDDVTLARKVESIVFRDADAPKGKVDINVADGRVELRLRSRSDVTVSRWGAQRQADLFRRAFGRELDVVD